MAATIDRDAVLMALEGVMKSDPNPAMEMITNVACRNGMDRLTNGIIDAVIEQMRLHGQHLGDLAFCFAAELPLVYLAGSITALREKLESHKKFVVAFHEGATAPNDQN